MNHHAQPDAHPESDRQEPPGDLTKVDPRVPGRRQGVADQPGYPDDDDDAVSDQEIDEVSDPRAEPGKPI